MWLGVQKSTISVQKIVDFFVYSIITYIPQIALSFVVKNFHIFLQITSKPQKIFGEFLHMNAMIACKSW